MQGVVVGHQPRQGKVAMSRPQTDYLGRQVRDANGKLRWMDEGEKVQGIVLLRKNEDSLPALQAIEAKVDELNNIPGKLLPGVQIEPYYDRTRAHRRDDRYGAREPGHGPGPGDPSILLMFLSNVRSALIVAINIPLALLFAFAVLYFRGKSANLLSIGAVDFGIIVESARSSWWRTSIATSVRGRMPICRWQDRILRASYEVERGLFFSIAIMVCAFVPLFTMKGPEGQIFGPMADTYAFALGGALLLALTVSPVLCLLLFRHLKPTRDNFLVRWVKSSYLRQLERCLNHRWATLAIFAVSDRRHGSARCRSWAANSCPSWKRATSGFAARFRSTSRWSACRTTCRRGAGDHAPAIPRSKPIVAQTGRPDDGTDPTGFYNVGVLRAAQAARRTGRSSQHGWRTLSARRAREPRRAGRGDERRAEPESCRRRLELLAEHPRQRHGSAVRRQGRQLGQDLRPGPGRAGETGRSASRTS